MKEKYLRMVFNEFMCAYGINDTFDNFDKYVNLFSQWVFDKKKASESYVELFEYMRRSNGAQPSVIVEFNKGKYDTTTVAMSTLTPHRAVMVTPYAGVITPDGIESYSGKISAVKNDIIISYDNGEDELKAPNCSPMINDQVDVMMTQMPIPSRGSLLLGLLNAKKTVVIGTYGLTQDKDKELNIEIIRTLSKLFKDKFKEVEFCSETLNGAYLSMLKAEPDVNVLHRELSRH